MNLIKNWKTTSAGILAIGTAIITLVYSIKAGHADASTWTGTLSAILVGIGLLLASDASASAQAHADSTAAISDLQTQVRANANAIVTGDTSIITKAQALQPPTTNPPSTP
jgi:uncharacterized membrane protein YidH (DUF202 family)